jgi:hypothetical protein
MTPRVKILGSRRDDYDAAYWALTGGALTGSSCQLTFNNPTVERFKYKHVRKSKTNEPVVTEKCYAM